MKEEVWSDQKKNRELSKEKKRLETEGEEFAALTRLAEDLDALIELGEESGDAGLLAEFDGTLAHFVRDLEALEVKHMLSGEHDEANAIISINSGAGGTESQDWTSMLMRMYQHWGEKKGYTTTIVDLLPGEEAGVKNCTLTLSGPFAFGYLKAEAGVHRLVRISPFDANKRRHTSFSSVFVTPEIDDAIEIEIDEKDLRVDTYRSSGSGGQHVNTTDSAIRLTHLPTGTVVACQNERSQVKNRSTAMKLLRSKLYELEMAKRKSEIKDIEDNKREISFGSQIRSYVLAPYRLIKDHRTDYETSNVDAVLDGELDGFIRAYLLRSP